MTHTFHNRSKLTEFRRIFEDHHRRSSTKRSFGDFSLLSMSKSRFSQLVFHFFFSSRIFGKRPTTSVIEEKRVCQKKRSLLENEWNLRRRGNDGLELRSCWKVSMKNTWTRFPKSWGSGSLIVDLVARDFSSGSPIWQLNMFVHANFRWQRDDSWYLKMDDIIFLFFTFI